MSTSTNAPANATTYSLTIAFVTTPIAETKDAVAAWLIMRGIDSFEEGSIASCDIPDESGLDKIQLFDELGGNESPIMLYSYDKAWLENLAKDLNADFGEAIALSYGQIATRDWQDGWKDGFRPITTRVFYLYPPWDTSACPSDKVPLIINPGMAFGTGQHATTQLSLEALEHLSTSSTPAEETLLDVGTGSGILSIAARKLGYAHVDACDIDPDAGLAVHDNCRLNSISGINFWSGSIMPTLAQRKACYQVIVANILFPVLEELLPHLARLLATNGTLILSGILVEQQEAMEKLCNAQGLVCTTSFAKDDWSCMIVHPKPEQKR